MNPMVEETIKGKFSKEKIKQAVVLGKPAPKATFELNEFARQVAEQFSANTVSPFVVAGLVRLADFLGILAIGLSIFLITHWPIDNNLRWSDVWPLVGAVLAVGFNQGIDGYLTSNLRQFGQSLSKSMTAMALATVLLGASAYLIKNVGDFPVNTLATWFSASIIYLCGLRLITTRIVRKLTHEGRLERRAVVVGGGERADDLIRSLESDFTSDIRICGIFDDRGGERSPENVAGYPKLGTVAELVEFSRKARIDMFIVTLPLTAEKRLLQLLKRLWVLPVDIRLSAHSDKLQFRPRSAAYEGIVPMVEIFDRPIADWDSVSKRVFDVVIASVAIVLLSPIMLLAALAVRLDSKGPVIFKQMREGFNNEEIEVYKFRSLRIEQEDQAGAKSVTKNDDRVTRVGRFIRRTSIDELPQLFNVLQGTLSLVGPRPHVPNAKTGNHLWTEVVDSYIARHKVKPGVTGWAQINGWRGEVDSEEKLKGRIEADLYYIENWSLLFDLKILALTPFRLMNTENAY